jgi:S1-C subfamily serine protease
MRRKECLPIAHTFSLQYSALGADIVTITLLALMLAPAGLPETVARVKPAVVAVGTVLPTRRPPVRYLGTGFAVGDGRLVLTNLHVYPEALDLAHKERVVAFAPAPGGGIEHEARMVASDREHDLALLAIEGEPLPSLDIGDSAAVREGDACAFTGYPLGVALGLHPVTHRGIVSAITPIALPVGRAAQLDAAAVRRIRAPFDVFQLDATAYPGNSGSPLFDSESGKVLGIVNMVLVKQTKEQVLSAPSGISYAIPAVWAQKLLGAERAKP